MSAEPTFDPIDHRTEGPSGAMLSPLRLPTNIVEGLLSAALEFGQQDLETGGFLLADDQDVVRALALTGERGIERHWGLFVVSGAVVEQVCQWAADHDLRVASLVHTHKRSAHMSKTDRNNGFRVEGFRSVIIPSFANPPTTLASWGWYVFENGNWRLDRPGELIGEPATDENGQVVVIDEQGVR